jgi:ClpP class serine protease
MMNLYAMEASFTAGYLHTLENASHEDREAALERFGSIELPGIVFREEGSDTAELRITGVLTPTGPSPIARFFGFEGTAYNDIVEAADLLAADESLTSVDILMDTPGGTVAGMSPARHALERLVAKKKVITYNHGMIASAGYYLATATPKIVAVSPLAKTGSIGVILAGIDVSEAMAKAGVKKIRIVSKNAPKKQPDPTTDSGKDILQEEINATERVFIRAVAEGRKTTDSDVIENFGKGGMLIAQDPDTDKPDATSVGMIDEVLTSSGVATEGGSDGFNAGPTTFQDFPMVDKPWDGDASVKRVRRFLNAEDSPNRRYRQAFFWYNSEESDTFGAYKLPFVDIVDGKMVANIRGVNAANGAMAGARGQRVQIPDADRPRVQSHIDRYRDKWQKKNGEGGDALEEHQTKEIIMDLNQFKAEHPAIFQEAVNVGVAQERERTEAHITMGEASGDTALAMECIKNGSELNASVNAKYLAAGMKNQAIAERSDESEPPIDIEASDTDVDDKALAAATAKVLGVEQNG